MTILTRYYPRYVRSLVYMVQASEYCARDFLAWYRRTEDFAHVENRKSIVWTVKARALYALSWVAIVLWVIGIIAYAGFTQSDFTFALSGTLIVLTPFVFPYALVGILLLVNMAQRPIEARLVREAKATLERHPGIKIAIAGSYGKTTMREILRIVLSTSKKVAAPPGSYNTPLGIAAFVKTLAGDENVVIFELGEYYPGDIKKLCDFVQPDVGIITGVNEAHLEKFGTLDKTTATIFELADFMGDTPIYINAENTLAREYAREGDILFSREYVGQWRVGGAQTDLRGTSFRIAHGGDIIRGASTLLGLHMVGPLAAAAVIARELGATLEEVEAGVKETKAFDHRMQVRIDNAGVITIDDSYNGNPDGAAAVIAFLAGITGHKRYYVTPGLVEMGARKEVVHKEIGRLLADAKIENVVLMQNSVTPFIEAGLREHGFKGKVLWYEDMPKALTSLAHTTVSGDIVLIQNDWPDQYA